MRKLYFCLFILGLQVLLVLPGFAQQFLPQNNAVKLSKRCYRVTENLGFQRGAIWWDSKIDLSQPIELDFIFYMGDKDAGADGMAFIFQNDPRGLSATGEAGGGLYFGERANPANPGGDKIVPSVAIEFDTWQNPCGDPTFDHTTVVYNGDVCNPRFPAVQINPNNANVEDNQCHNYKIKWNPATQELQMFFEGNLRFTYKDDIINTVFGGVTQVYYGFAGSTGGSINEQSVCVLQGNTVPVANDDQVSLPLDTPVVTNVLSNDVEPDGDPLFVTKIVTPPSNGTATIQNATTITYTPNPSYTGSDQLVYQVCDINADNCYANCSVATVRYLVGCTPINLSAVKVKDNVKCDDALANNGGARAFVVQGASQVTAGYTFRWYNGTDTTVTPTYVGANQQAMAEGNYQVVAINNLSRCRSTLGNVSIARVNETISPDDIQLVQQSSVTSCNAPNGSLSASVKNQTAGYSFTWYLDAADIGNPTRVVGVGPSVSGLQARSYTVHVREVATGCVGIKAMGVVKTAVDPVLQLVALTHFTSCISPNGSVSVNVGGATAGFTFEWYNGTAVRNDPADFVGPVYGSLRAGSYTVRATNTQTGCRSSPVTHEVLDQTPAFTPSITLENVSSGCLNDDGSLRATILLTNVQGYSYQWYTGQPPVDASRIIASATSDIIGNLRPGIYTVEVTNRDNGCKAYSTRAITLPSQPVVELDRMDASTSCSTPNGELRFRIRNFNVFPAGTTFTYEWYRGNNVSTDPSLRLPATTNTLVGLSPGDYTVVAITSGCRSNPVTATVTSTAVKPDVDIRIVTETDCAGSNGALLVVDAGTGSPLVPGSATFAWYSGKTPAASPIGTSDLLSGLTTGFYTAVVRNTASGCSDTASIYLPSAVLFPIQVAVTAEPVTNCSLPNGRLEAKVTNDNGTYTFQWFNVNDPSQPVGNTAVLEGLPVGNYRVEVANADGQACPNVATPPAVAITNATVNPVVSISQDAPMRNCDPSRGNGQLSASVEGDLSQYTFAWFKGTNPAGATILSTTPIAPNLSADTYSVRVTNPATGCDTIMSYAVQAQPTPVPAPTPEILNQMTSCIQPNGKATASVAGNTSRYVFNWYQGNGGQTPPFFTGLEVNGLDLGVYSVTATDKETGCVSERATFTIVDGRIYPEFALRVVNSTCTDQTGVIEVIVTKGGNLAQITWSAGATTPNATNISEQPMGEYEVTLTTVEGCSTTKKARIGANVQVYNGVSANNDGLNDHLIIDCIETFPDNNVKILNRAGALVFEGSSYDNVQVKFEGTGNRGMYVTGSQLPVGTYFYIIDKKDGTQPLSGYLELVR